MTRTSIAFMLAGLAPAIGALVGAFIAHIATPRAAGASTKGDESDT